MARVRMIPIPLKPVSYTKTLIRPTIELTGYGDLLCFDAYAGRFFRSSREHVLKALEEFKKLYSEKELYLSWNDLHELLGISLTYFGNRYGYSPDEDYRNGDELTFDTVLVPKEEHFEGMDEDVFVIEIGNEWCCPYDFYMEV